MTIGRNARKRLNAVLRQELTAFNATCSKSPPPFREHKPKRVEFWGLVTRGQCFYCDRIIERDNLDSPWRTALYRIQEEP